MGKKELVDISCKVMVETDRAWKVNDGSVVEWVPKSQCEIEKLSDGSAVLTCPEWLAKEKGFI